MTTPINLERDESRGISRRRLAQVAITTLSVVGFGGAALSGVMSAPQRHRPRQPLASLRRARSRQWRADATTARRAG
jgi:hypothetical protein